MASLGTSVVLPFAITNGSGRGALSLSGCSDFVGMGSVGVALVDDIPTGALQIYATAGTIEHTDIVSERPNPGAFIQVSGSNIFSVPQGAEYSILFAYRADGAGADTRQVASVGGKVTVAERFWGLVKVSPSTTRYKVLRYTPEMSRYGDLGSLTTWGIIAAYKDGSLATYEVPLPTINSGADELEIYRIESKVLINKDGEWEMPNGWPDNPSYPNGATPPKPRVGVVSTRVHEVGMVTAQGSFFSREFTIVPVKPYFGLASYKPAVEIVQGSGMSTLPPDMQMKAMEAMQARGKANLI